MKIKLGYKVRDSSWQYVLCNLSPKDVAKEIQKLLNEGITQISLRKED